MSHHERPYDPRRHNEEDMATWIFTTIDGCQFTLDSDGGLIVVDQGNQQIPYTLQETLALRQFFSRPDVQQRLADIIAADAERDATTRRLLGLDE